MAPPSAAAPRSYGRRLAELAAVDPDRVALICEEGNFTRADLDRRANQLARIYAARGLGQDDRATVMLQNGLEFFAACLAIWRLGAVPNPVSHRLPEPERRAIIHRAQPALIIGANRANGGDGGDGGDGEGIPWVPEGFEPEPSVSDAPLPDRTAPNERAMASGGSTGLPKLIVAANPGVYQEASASALFKAKRAVLVPGPLYHAAPWSSAWQGLFAGCTVVVMRRFDARRSLELIETHRIDRMNLVPTMMLRIWRLPPSVRESYDVSSLEFVMTGGAPCPAWLMRAWIDWLGQDIMNEAFGPSERIGGTFITGPEWLAHPGSVGRPVGGARIKILDDAGQRLAPGQMGEIYMMPQGGRGSTYSYVGARARVDGEGWESVGDMGYLDDEGYLYLGDRRSDMILSGGRNIYPAEIEAAIELFPGVQSSAVIGLPDDDLGQTLHAIIEIDDEFDLEASADGALAESALQRHLGAQLAQHKVPRSVEFVRERLRDDAGKLRRSALRATRISAIGQKSQDPLP